MKKLFFYSATILLLSACVSVPEQAVMSQELVLKGIESAEKNQISLINAYADDQIDNVKKLMSTVVIDKVLKKQLKGRQTLSADEAKQLILEYADDLNKQITKIESQRRELLKVATEGYGELISLSKSNLSLTRSLSKVTQEQEQFLGDYKQKLQNVEGSLLRYIKP